MGVVERYRARLGRVMDDGPPGEKRIAVVMADCGLHTHAAKIARALNQHEGAVGALEKIGEPIGGIRMSAEMAQVIAQEALGRLGGR